MNSSKPNLVDVKTTYSMATKNLTYGDYYYFFSTQQLAGDGFTSKNTTLVWVQGDQLMEIYADIELEEIFKIANSVTYQK